MDAPFSDAQFISFKIALAAMVVAALIPTRVHEFYPDADVIVRIRNKRILPEIEIQDRLNKQDKSKKEIGEAH